jgi:SecD/SecF fusion protein
MATFTFQNQQPPTIDEMQKRLDKAFNESIALEELTTSDKPPRKLVRIRTTKTDPNEVSTLVSEAFADASQKLNRQEVTIGSLAQVPFEPQTDFSGGQQLDLKFNTAVSPLAIRDALADSLAALKGENGQVKYSNPHSLLNVANVGDAKSSEEVVVQATPAVAGADLAAAAAQYKTVAEARPLFEELNNFDQAVAGQTQWIAITAVVISMLATIAYLWFRFQSVEFGLAAIVAVVHDLLAVMGLVTIVGLFSNNPIAKALGLADFKLNLSMVASYLTIVGYSLNDTIVVFDRIREIRGKGVTVSRQLVDQALNQTLSRTLLTGVTTLIVIFIMYAIGGEGLRGFAFTLFMGIVIGTYSSIYIASPTLVWLMNRKRQSAVRGAVNPRYQGGSGGMVTSPR